jgi:RNA polymerase sigma-70 factor (ECF subfamily)
MVDETAFTLQSQELLPALYRMCMNILRSEADAQDAVQQCLMKGWSHRADVSQDRLRPWLMRIAVNECRNIQRYRKRVYPAPTPAPSRPGGPPDADLWELSEAIGRMDQKLRVPLLLKYRENYTEKEIAAVLRVPVSTVKNRLYRARRELQKSLADVEVAFE